MLSKEEILHIATLARIGVSEKDVEKYQHDLSDILDYFKKLEEADTEGVEQVGGFLPGVSHDAPIHVHDEFLFTGINLDNPPNVAVVYIFVIVVAGLDHLVAHAKGMTAYLVFNAASWWIEYRL